MNPGRALEDGPPVNLARSMIDLWGMSFVFWLAADLKKEIDQLEQ